MNEIFRIIIICVTLLCLTFSISGCRHEEPEKQAAVENALKTAIEAMEHAKAAQARMDKLEARMNTALEQIKDQGKEAGKKAEEAQQAAITAQNAAERAETSAIKCEKIFERSLMK